MNRKIVIVFIILSLVVLWTWRYKSLNGHYQSICYDQGHIYYQLDEEVQLGGYKMDKYTKDLTGYSITVKSLEIVNATDFFENRQISIEDMPMGGSYSKIALVRIILDNKLSDEDAVDIFSISLCGIDWTMSADLILLPICNPILEGNGGIHLPYESSCELILPFSLPRQVIFSDWNRLDKIPIFLRLTYEPAQLMVRLQN